MCVGEWQESRVVGGPPHSRVVHQHQLDLGQGSSKGQGQHAPPRTKLHVCDPRVHQAHPVHVADDADLLGHVSQLAVGPTLHPGPVVRLCGGSHGDAADGQGAQGRGCVKDPSEEGLWSRGRCTYGGGKGVGVRLDYEPAAGNTFSVYG